MNKLILFALFVPVAATGAYFLFKNSGPSTDEVISLIREGNPELYTAEVVLKGCQLTLRSSNSAEDGSLTRIGLNQAYLSDFQLDRMNVSDAGGQNKVATFQRGAVSDKLITRVHRVTELLPRGGAEGGQLTLFPSTGGQITTTSLEQESDGGISRDIIRQSLSAPGGTLGFRFTTLISSKVDGEEMILEPEMHEDAPGFVEFARAAMALDGEITMSASLLFDGQEETPQALRTGAIEIPSKLQFLTVSQVKAVELGRALYEYKNVNCPS